MMDGFLRAVSRVPISLRFPDTEYAGAPLPIFLFSPSKYAPGPGSSEPSGLLRHLDEMEYAGPVEPPVESLASGLITS